MTRRSQTFARAVIGRDKMCQDCGAAKDLQAHHIIPMGASGSDIPDNGEALCPGHHADRHPDVPRGLFFKSSSGKVTKDAYNATTLAAKLECHTRTITRAAHRLGIGRIGGAWAFSDDDAIAIESTIKRKIDKPKEITVTVTVAQDDAVEWKHCPHCGEQIHDANATPKSQLVRMRITDAEKERVLVIPPRRRTEVLLDECDRLADDAGGNDEEARG